MSQIPGGKTGLRIPTPGTSPLSPAAASKLQTQRKSGKKLADKSAIQTQPDQTAGSGVKKPDAPNKEEEEKQSLNVTIPPITNSTLHRDLSKCPCDQSKSSWKIDCSRCQQFWHVDCLGLTGLSQAGYNKLTEYLCPFCYVAPVATTVTETSACYICRNTLSLQQSNNQHEVAIAASKLQSMDNFCKTVDKINFESLTKQMGIVENLDLHLQHLLLDKDSLKHQQERVKKVDDTVMNLEAQITQLQGQVSELVNRPHPTQKCSSTLTDEFLTTITSRLDKICEEEPKIAEGLESLKASVGALELVTATAITTSVEPVAASPLTYAEAETASSDDFSGDPASHNMQPVHMSKEDFITGEFEEQLTQLLNSRESEFQAEGGHSVLYFGEQYRYTGSTSSNSYQAIPQLIGSLIQKINNEFCTGDTPKVNSCLVNKYEGSESHLPKHSDDEPTIHPESQIITLSLGSECALRFSDKNCEDIVLEHMTRSRSIYSMTRKSQEFFEHRIDHGSISEGRRFSLTFRSISWRNRNATCIIGDSNTAGLKFGDVPKKSFGKALPGKQFAAPLVKDINPYDTCGYSNVVVMCGINNLKADNIKTPKDVRGIYNSLVSKIKLIQDINTKAHIFICPVLPTKRLELNRKGICFNQLILNELLLNNFGVTFVDGFQNFLDENGLLSQDLSRNLNKYKRPDFLHLNWKGVAKLSSMIKSCVLLRKSGGVDKRKKTRVDGTQYSDVAAGRVPQNDGYQAS